MSTTQQVTSRSPARTAHVQQRSAVPPVPDRLEVSAGYCILFGLLAALRPAPASDLTAALLEEFGSLPAVLGSSPAALRRVVGDDPQLVACLVFARSAMLHALSAELRPETILSDIGALHRYLDVAMAHALHEQVRVLFLNSANHLLRDEIVSHGTPSSAAFEIREILRRAVELGASALIVAHNHPSGNPEPSSADLRETRSLAQGGDALGIVVHDHIIVSRGSYRSMREMRLI